MLSILKCHRWIGAWPTMDAFAVASSSFLHCFGLGYGRVCFGWRKTARRRRTPSVKRSINIIVKWRFLRFSLICVRERCRIRYGFGTTTRGGGEITASSCCHAGGSVSRGKRRPARNSSCPADRPRRDPPSRAHLRNLRDRSQEDRHRVAFRPANLRTRNFRRNRRSWGRGVRLPARRPRRSLPSHTLPRLLLLPP